MQLHQLSSIQKQKVRKRVGRGGKRGTYSGRGIKGQKARAGRKLRPEWRDVLKRIPKRRGYRFRGAKEQSVVLNLGKLDQFFKDGDLVTPDVLFKKGLVVKTKGRTPLIKILGDGALTKKLDFKGFQISQGAKEKIEKAGGKIS